MQIKYAKIAPRILYFLRLAAEIDHQLHCACRVLHSDRLVSFEAQACIFLLYIKDGVRVAKYREQLWNTFEFPRAKVIFAFVWKNCFAILLASC